jgi:hypothetical protein
LEAKRTDLLLPWIETILEDIEEGTAAFSYDPEDIARLEKTLAELKNAPHLPK